MMIIIKIMILCVKEKVKATKKGIKTNVPVDQMN